VSETLELDAEVVGAWRLDGGVELSKVVVHDDMTIE
jgi:hypothetical protein